jgi:hypothetical protein
MVEQTQPYRLKQAAVLLRISVRTAVQGLTIFLKDASIPDIEKVVVGKSL